MQLVTSQIPLKIFHFLNEMSNCAPPPPRVKIFWIQQLSFLHKITFSFLGLKIVIFTGGRQNRVDNDVHIAISFHDMKQIFFFFFVPLAVYPV